MHTKPNQHISQRGFIPVLLIVLGAISIVGLSVGGYYVFKNKEASVVNTDGQDNNPVESMTEIVSPTEQVAQPISIDTKKSFNLEDYRLKEKVDIFDPKYRVVSLNNTQYSSQLSEILSEVHTLIDATLEIKLEIVELENKLSELRIDNLKKLNDLTEGVSSNSFEELIKIEKIRESNVGLIFNDFFFEADIYSFDIKDTIKMLDGGSTPDAVIKAKQIIANHPQKINALKNSSEDVINTELSESKLYIKEAQSRLDITANIATRIVRAQKDLDTIERIRQELEDSFIAGSYDIYSLPRTAEVSSVRANTTNLSCKYPTSKYILVPGKGWISVKQCGDGTYIEANKYIPDHSSMTPQQVCDARKSNWLGQGAIVGSAPDCSDLGL